MTPRSGLDYTDQSARDLKNKYPEGRPGAGSRMGLVDPLMKARADPPNWASVRWRVSPKRNLVLVLVIAVMTLDSDGCGDREPRHANHCRLRILPPR
jgi:hypothetical protein